MAVVVDLLGGRVLCAGNKDTHSGPFLCFMSLMYISVKTTLPHIKYIYIYSCSTYALVDEVIFIPFDKFFITCHLLCWETMDRLHDSM